jgi:hypothetical protein
MLPILVNNFVSNLRTLKRPAAAAVSHVTQVNFDNVSLTFSTVNTTLTTIDEDNITNGGQTVASILGNTVTDADIGRSKALPLPATMMATALAIL